MNQKQIDRRNFIKMLAVSTGGVVASGIFKSNLAAAADWCSKVDQKHSAKMMVTALKYVDVSKTPKQKCENCIQYKADSVEKSGGHCVILQNCLVKSSGWCASWSKKA